MIFIICQCANCADDLTSQRSAFPIQMTIVRLCSGTKKESLRLMSSLAEVSNVELTGSGALELWELLLWIRHLHVWQWTAATLISLISPAEIILERALFQEALLRLLSLRNFFANFRSRTAMEDSHLELQFSSGAPFSSWVAEASWGRLRLTVMQRIHGVRCHSCALRWYCGGTAMALRTHKHSHWISARRSRSSVDPPPSSWFVR